MRGSKPVSRLLPVALALVVTALGTSTASTATAAPAAGPHVTLLFSRTAITAANDCQRSDAGVMQLDTQVAPALAALGLLPTGSIETGATLDSANYCSHYRLSVFASWDQARTLADDYGWSFVSHTKSYPHDQALWSSLSASQLFDETCGSEQAITAHGLPGATGLFAWPDNFVYSPALPYVEQCYDFNRHYGSGITDQAAAIQAPYAQSTTSFTGGACADPKAACYSYSFTLSPTRYRSPAAMLAKVTHASASQWVTLQSYVLVTGAQPGEWDCTAPSWTDHWTDDTERYCWNDYLSVVTALPATAVVADPATVGGDWGRSVTGQATPPPSLSSMTPSSGPDGTLVTLAGRGLADAESISFNGTPAEFVIGSDTTLTAWVPTGATSGPITVTTPEGSTATLTRFKVTPVISIFSPQSGSVGTVVEIGGSGLLGTTSVKFHGVPAPFTVMSDSVVTASVPAGATTGVIRVATSGGGTSSGTSFVVTG
jgi:hypothetical protein